MLESVESARHRIQDPLPGVLVLGSAVGIDVAFITPGGTFSAVVAVVLALAGLVSLRRHREAAALALATAACAVVYFVPAVAHWVPAPLLGALSVLFLVSRLRPPWLVRGELGREVVAWTIAIAIVSGVVLVVWWNLVRPDVSDLTMASELRHTVDRSAIRVVALVGWAVLNAMAEEFFFRGALQSALTQSFGPMRGVVIQAVSFGFIHYRGFPRGWSGIVLATLYGLMLGALRQRARGLLAPWVAHVAADVIIAVILLSVASSIL